MAKRKRLQSDVYFPGSPEKKARQDKRANIRHVEISRLARGGAYKAVAFGRKSTVLAKEDAKHKISASALQPASDDSNPSEQVDSSCELPATIFADDDFEGDAMQSLADAEASNANKARRARVSDPARPNNSYLMQ
jgi:hypothetical protein